jgi:HlyD family secretion protein
MPLESGMTTPSISNTRRWGRRCLLLASLGALGCDHEEKSHYVSAAKPPTVQVIHPEFRDINRTVGQPSFVEAYERTSIYPKLTAYIDKWIVDIGDKVNKGDVLARLFVPELVEDFATKRATVKLDEQRIELARKMVDVNDANVQAADAGLDQSHAILGKYQAEVDRWDTEVKRMTREVEKGVVDPQVLLESTKQLKSSTAARDEANATIKKAEADLLSAKAQFAKAKVDVMVAQADLGVATSDAKRMEAWVGYLTLTAPFDGIISARNANTSDFVLPSSGDPNADSRSPDLSPSRGAAPIYVVDRTDIVRIFVDIPEQDANYVKIGAKASVLIRAYRDEPIPGTVTRTSWALNVRSRTLRAEVDLTNPLSELLPGMYAYASVIIERPGVPALPVSAISHAGDNTFCWTYKEGHAQRTEVRTGVSDGEYIEVTNLQFPSSSKVKHPWKPVTGSEEILLGDLSTLSDGDAVTVDASAGASKNASRAPAPPAVASRRP